MRRTDGKWRARELRAMESPSRKPIACAPAPILPEVEARRRRFCTVGVMGAWMFIMERPMPLARWSPWDSLAPVKDRSMWVRALVSCGGRRCSRTCWAASSVRAAARSSAPYAWVAVVPRITPEPRSVASCSSTPQRLASSGRLRRTASGRAPRHAWHCGVWSREKPAGMRRCASCVELRWTMRQTGGRRDSGDRGGSRPSSYCASS